MTVHELRPQPPRGGEGKSPVPDAPFGTGDRPRRGLRLIAARRHRYRPAHRFEVVAGVLLSQKSLRGQRAVNP